MELNRAVSHVATLLTALTVILTVFCTSQIYLYTQYGLGWLIAVDIVSLVIAGIIVWRLIK